MGAVSQAIPPMRAPTLLLTAALPALSACAYTFDALSGRPGAATPAPAVRFVAFGDAGSGTARQGAVGRAMAQVCAARRCDFALELGDNFYPAGITAANDPQFQDKFERPYALLNVPVYAVLGNHDNGTHGGEGNNNARGDFQVGYRSEKWRMPARYYRFSAPDSAAPLADFFALDSNPLASYEADPDPRWEPASYGGRQLRWLRQQMTASHARWKIAFGHHPYVSNGLHGNAGDYDAAHPGQGPTARGAPWKALLDQSVCALGADLYLAGHDHDLEWLVPQPACGRTQFLVSGAGAPDKSRPFGDPARNPVYWHADRAAGFFWIQLDGQNLTVAAYTLDADDSLPVDAHGRAKAAYERTLVQAEPAHAATGH